MKYNSELLKTKRNGPLNFSYHSVPFSCQVLKENTKCKSKLSKTDHTVSFKLFVAYRPFSNCPFFHEKCDIRIEIVHHSLFALPANSVQVKQNVLSLSHFSQHIVPFTIRYSKKFFAAYCSFNVRFLKKIRNRLKLSIKRCTGPLKFSQITVSFLTVYFSMRNWK
jgi:hypothetical protein